MAVQFCDPGAKIFHTFFHQDSHEQDFLITVTTTPTNISIVTAMYRTEAFFPSYVQHALTVAKSVTNAGLSLEFICVVKDASAVERDLLAQFSDSYPHVRVIHIDSGGMYRNWNVGTQAAAGEMVAFWNVDDIRTADALIKGYEKIKVGCQLVYPAYTQLRMKPGSSRSFSRTYEAVAYDRDMHRHKMRCSPFFMFNPALYAKVGAFDERYRIAGDFDWCARATDHAHFCPLDADAGTFWLHGGNLSDTGNPLQAVEDNMVHLLLGDWQYLKPADPELMRSTWEKWGEAETHPLPAEVTTMLWGDGAYDRWQTWLRDYRRTQRRAAIETALRYWPKRLIDSTGLRPRLAQLGLVKARPSKLVE